MKDERKTEIKVGLTVILAIICLVFIISWAKNISVAANRKLLTVRFQSVSGLEIGDQVTVSGVRKGYVEDIVTDKTTVLAKVSLDPDITIKKDAVFRVEMLDLMGGKKIEIAPGSDNSEIDFSAVANGEFSADIPSVMRTVGTMTQDMPEMMASLKVTLNELKNTLTDEELKNNLKTTVAQLKEVTTSLNVFINKNSSNMATLIATSKDVMQESKELIKKNGPEIEKTLQNIQTVSENSNELLKKLDSFLVETKDQKNNLGKALYDDTLLKETKALVTSIQETLKILNNQLKNDGVNVRAKIDLF